MQSHAVLRKGLTRLGRFTSHPAAFGVVGVYVAAWAIFNPSKLDWHAGATIATWLMTLVIQRVEHRDTQAIHAKLDELIRSHSGARDAVAGIDAAEPEEIVSRRADTMSRLEVSTPA